MPGLAPGIHVFSREIVDGRDKRGHDKIESARRILLRGDIGGGADGFHPKHLALAGEEIET
jgi:hypothetical protein